MKAKIHKRRLSSEMAALTIAMLVSPVTMTKGGGPHVFTSRRLSLTLVWLVVVVLLLLLQKTIVFRNVHF